MNRTTTPLLIAALCALCACAPPAGEEAHADVTAAPPAPTNRIAIPPTVRRNLGITFARVEVRDVARTLRVPGAFELQPRARREYAVALPGSVQLLVDQYERVEAGTPLFRYRSPAWAELQQALLAADRAAEAARAELAVAAAALEEARRTADSRRARLEALERAEFRDAALEVDLAAQEAALPRLEAELELARTRSANARAARAGALRAAATAAGLGEVELLAEAPTPDGGALPRYATLEWLEVRALVPGRVERLAVTDGAFVEAPTTVLSTVDPDLLRFRAQALQSDLPALAGAQGARIVPAPTPGLPEGAGVAAALTLGLEADPAGRTIALVATPAELAPWTRAGLSAFLEVTVAGTGTPALAVPRSAVVLDGLQHVVFRRDPADPNQAIRIEADLGVDDGRWVVLQSGVARGDEVVVDGAYELKLATQQSGAAQQGGHFHADGSYHGEH